MFDLDFVFLQILRDSLSQSNGGEIIFLGFALPSNSCIFLLMLLWSYEILFVQCSTMYFLQTEMGKGSSK